MILFCSFVFLLGVMSFLASFSSCVLRPASCVSHSISKSLSSYVTLKSSSVTCDEISLRIETESESNLTKSPVVSDRFATQDAGPRTQDRFEFATQDAGPRTQDESLTKNAHLRYVMKMEHQTI